MLSSGAADFYPRPPRGGRPDGVGSCTITSGFLSTPSARRATRCPASLIWSRWYFYPRPPRGGRRAPLLWISMHTIFLSTPSARRATAGLAQSLDDLRISIHALREEGDRYFNCNNAPSNSFLSTPSARRATCTSAGRFHSEGISIHALREEGDGAARAAERSRQYFYPRPPRGGRQLSGFFYDSHHKFLSTPSARRATVLVSMVIDREPISIHALREEGDRDLRYGCRAVRLGDLRERKKRPHLVENQILKSLKELFK